MTVYVGDGSDGGFNSVTVSSFAIHFDKSLFHIVVFSKHRKFTKTAVLFQIKKICKNDDYTGKFSLKALSF